ncbi:Protein of uncharacterised function (DUF3298) [Kingella potus]|uniref:Protein of uncharacterized function (DUF3298) n=1 Tax=Kingella potus TaxID=265175 RepID=A0A377R1C0_9NEIS|nr:hypothetical protein [Kingella potus]UOP00234.1 hypothetical protein LVJ84_09905 [Kingella potus]STR02708.1 Protein of uncharacterised function (DUF3298) [Kingella potus]
MNKILPALLLAAFALPAAAQPPQFKTAQFQAEYCPKPAADPECSKFSISRPVFRDRQQTAFAEQLIRQMTATDGLKTLTKAAALQKLKKQVNESREGKEAYPRHEYFAEVAPEGYTPHYLVLTGIDYIYGGGPHGLGRETRYIIPRSGKPVPLRLDDILLPGQKPAFAALHRQALTDYYLAEGNRTREEIEEGFNNKRSSHYLTDEVLESSWSFDKNALSYAYNSYSFGGYTDTPAFKLPAAKLKGIVKPEILRELEAYRPLKN